MNGPFATHVRLGAVDVLIKNQIGMDLPDVIKADLSLAASRDQRVIVLKSARAAGWSLETIGRAVGLSRQRVQQLTELPIAPSRLYDYPQPIKKRAIMGPRILRVPEERLRELKALQSKISKINGSTYVDDPLRDVASVYGDLLVQTMSEYEVGPNAISTAMGLSSNNVRLWLGRHGYLKRAPSQPAYRRTTNWQSRSEHR